MTAKVAVAPAQTLLLPGWVPNVTEALIVIDAFATGSLLGILSITAFTLPVPEPVAVNVTVAVPFAWIAVCAPERVPETGFTKLIGRLINALRSVAEITFPAELESKLAVTVEVLLGVTEQM